jgi:signal transduction histidine kinase
MDENKHKSTPAGKIPDMAAASVRPVYDKATFVRIINQEIPGSELLQGLIRCFVKDQTLLAENDSNSNLYIILDGVVEQFKENRKENTPIGLHGPGDFIGLLSFQTGEPVFTTAKAATDVVTLSLDHRSFETFLNEYPQISRTLQGLIFSNLADRYRRVVTLHTEVATLTKQLEREQNHLKKIINELKRTRNALISQEKMATLGEMTAGLAHEINNPASALLRSVEYLSVHLPVLAEKASALPDTGLVRYYFEAGMKREFTPSSIHRERMKEISLKYAFLSRPDLRGLAEMDQELFGKIVPFIHPSQNKELLQLLLDAYQSGIFLNNIRISTSRIEYLVKSLKSYSRKPGSAPEYADIREGIRETLQILGSRLKDVKVDIHMPEPAIVECFVGEINQVWTNIIINACDAMDNRGLLFIRCTVEPGDQMVAVTIADSGPGVPDKLKKKIFDPTFTTKTAGGDFGLGIGLAISKSIVEKHHGTIEVNNRDGGGAEFLIRLPSAKKE